jgi:hypothetical protein
LFAATGISIHSQDALLMSRLPRRLFMEALEDRLVPAAPSAAPPLPPPPADAIYVSTVAQLQSAVANLQSGKTIVIQPGTYNLTAPLRVGQFGPVTDFTIRGATGNYSDVVIRAAGGWENTNVGYGFWLANAQRGTIADLSVGEVYYHAVSMEGWAGADDLRLHHVRLYNAGQQLIKGNPGGSNGGVERATIEYSLLEYTNGPPTTDHGGGIGYMGAAHIHNAIDWAFRHNLIRGVVAPANSAHPTPANILAWNQSRGTIVEGNTFLDNTRGVAFGLVDHAAFDHSGGIIRNNFFFVTPGLLTPAQRSFNSQVIVYDSPNTLVEHNTIMSDLQFSIEFLGASTNGTARNNLANTPIGTRNGATWQGAGNYLQAVPQMFVDAVSPSIDLHLLDNTLARTHVIDQANQATQGAIDWDGHRRLPLPDIGADEVRLPIYVPPKSWPAKVNPADLAFLADLTLPTHDFFGKSCRPRKQ